MELKPEYNNQMSQLPPNAQQDYLQYPQQQIPQYPQQQIPQYPQQDCPQYPPQYPQQQIPQCPQQQMPQYPQQDYLQYPQYPQQQIPQYPQQDFNQQAPPAVSEVKQKEEKEPVVKTKYPNGIRPPSNAVQVNPYPVIPVPVAVSTVPFVGGMPYCLTCGGTGYYLGRRCICRGRHAAEFQNARLLHMGLMHGAGYY